MRFLQIASKMSDIGIDLLEPEDLDATLETAEQRARLVVFEVMARAAHEHVADFRQASLDLAPAVLALAASRNVPPVLRIRRERAPQGVGREDVVGRPGDAARHIRRGCGRERLRHRHAAGGADRSEPEDTIRLGAGEYDADSA